MAEQKDHVDINWVQVSGSALAAVTSAVLLSTVGVAGTIIGAAIGSVFATAGSAIYQHYLRVSRARVAAAQAAARDRVSRAREAMHTGRFGVADTRSVTVADRELGAAEEDLDEAERSAGSGHWRENLAGLAWRKVAVLTAGVFAVVMLVIVGFELVSGESVSTLTGGSADGGHRTSLGFGRADSATSKPTPSPSLGDGTTPSTSVPSSSAPTATPSQAPTTSAPTSTATPTGGGAEPSSTPSPSASATTPAPSSTPTTSVPTPTSSATAPAS